MNTAIEIHDSRVAEISASDGTVTVYLRPAYLHKSEGRPAFDSGTGWVQEVRLVFSEASVGGDFPDWPCDIMGGEIIVDGKRHKNLIPVPFKIGKLTELRLIFDSVHVATIKGQGAKLELVGEPKFVEEVPDRKPARQPET